MLNCTQNELQYIRKKFYSEVDTATVIAKSWNINPVFTRPQGRRRPDDVDDIENHEFTHDEHKIHLTASFGGARYPDVCAEDLSLEALLDEVDEALEEAKQLGRNQSVIAPVIQEGI